MHEWVQGGMEGGSKERRKQARNRIQGMGFQAFGKLDCSPTKNKQCLIKSYRKFEQIKCMKEEDNRACY